MPALSSSSTTGGGSEDSSVPLRVVTVGETVDAIGTNRPFHFILAVIVGFAFAAEAVEIFLISYLTTTLDKEFSSTPSSYGLNSGSLASAVFVGMLVGCAVSGPLSDWYGRRPAVLGFALLGSLGGIASAWTHSWETMYICRCLVGIGAGGGHIAPTVLLELIPTSKREYYIATTYSLWTWGIMVQCIVAYVVMGYLEYSWRVFVVLSALPLSLVAVLGYFYLPESPRWLLSHAKTQLLLESKMKKSQEEKCKNKATSKEKNEGADEACYLSLDELLKAQQEALKALRFVFCLNVPEAQLKKEADQLLIEKEKLSEAILTDENENRMKSAACLELLFADRSTKVEVKNTAESPPSSCFFDQGIVLCTSEEERSKVLLPPGSYPKDFKSDSSSEGSQSIMQVLKLSLSSEYRRLTLSFWLCWACVSCCYYGLSMLTTRQFLQNDAYFSIFFFCSGELPCYPLLFWAPKKYGRRRSLGVVALLCIALLALWGYLSLGRPDLIEEGIGFLFGLTLVATLRCFMLFLFDLVFFFSPESYPVNIRTTATGWCSAWARVSSAVTPLIAFPLQAANPIAPYFYFGTMYFLLFLGAVFIPVETNGVDIDEEEEKKAKT